MKTIKELVAEGHSMDRIIEILAYQEELENDKAKVVAYAAKRAEQSAKYYADKEANGAKCVTCGCSISVNNTSGYCRKHVAKAVLTKAVKAPKIKYKTITFYGVKGEDLMDHKYYQGGLVSPR